jgi:divinyl chlorophyllide a 8-vinyl-reductase
VVKIDLKVSYQQVTKRQSVETDCRLSPHHLPARVRVLLAGATGYIGRQVAAELSARGYEVVCLLRAHSGVLGKDAPDKVSAYLPHCELRVTDVTQGQSLEEHGFRGEQFDVVISCLASRSGGIEDSWRIDYGANHLLLQAAIKSGVQHFVLLSAICVQKPRLAFQHAKLKMEQALIDSGMIYSIVRPTAFFKSIAGQLESIKKGRACLIFSSEDTACKPIAEADLAEFMVDCLEDSCRHNRILPIGGPDPATTGRQRGIMIFELLGREPKFRCIPVALLDAIIFLLSALGRLLPGLRDKAEFARIARYYATESMLVLNPVTGQYDASATPSYGRRTLREFYKHALEHGLAGQELGEHAFKSGKLDKPAP